MATSLRSQLDALASSFAEAILDALRSTPLDELVETEAPARGSPSAFELARAARSQPSSRLHRRSAEEVASAVEKIVTLLKKHRGGLRAEQIRALLGVQAKEMPRVLKQGLAAKQLRSTGQKRATTYFSL